MEADSESDVGSKPDTVIAGSGGHRTLFAGHRAPFAGAGVGASADGVDLGSHVGTEVDGFGVGTGAEPAPDLGDDRRAGNVHRVHFDASYDGDARSAGARGDNHTVARRAAPVMGRMVPRVIEQVNHPAETRSVAEQATLGVVQNRAFPASGTGKRAPQSAAQSRDGSGFTGSDGRSVSTTRLAQQRIRSAPMTMLTTAGILREDTHPGQGQYRRPSSILDLFTIHDELNSLVGAVSTRDGKAMRDQWMESLVILDVQGDDKSEVDPEARVVEIKGLLDIELGGIREALDGRSRKAVLGDGTVIQDDGPKLVTQFTCLDALDYVVTGRPFAKNALGEFVSKLNGCNVNPAWVFAVAGFVDAVDGCVPISAAHVADAEREPEPEPEPEPESVIGPGPGPGNGRLAAPLARSFGAVTGLTTVAWVAPALSAAAKTYGIPDGVGDLVTGALAAPIGGVAAYFGAKVGHAAGSRLSRGNTKPLSQMASDALTLGTTALGVTSVLTGTSLPLGEAALWTSGTTAVAATAGAAFGAATSVGTTTPVPVPAPAPAPEFASMGGAPTGRGTTTQRAGRRAAALRKVQNATQKAARNVRQFMTQERKKQRSESGRWARAGKRIGGVIGAGAMLGIIGGSDSTLRPLAGTAIGGALGAGLGLGLGMAADYFGEQPGNKGFQHEDLAAYDAKADILLLHVAQVDVTVPAPKSAPAPVPEGEASAEGSVDNNAATVSNTTTARPDSLVNIEDALITFTLELHSVFEKTRTHSGKTAILVQSIPLVVHGAVAVVYKVLAAAKDAGVHEGYLLLADADTHSRVSLVGRRDNARVNDALGHVREGNDIADDDGQKTVMTARSSASKAQTAKSEGESVLTTQSALHAEEVVDEFSDTYNEWKKKSAALRKSFLDMRKVFGRLVDVLSTLLADVGHPTDPPVLVHGRAHISTLIEWFKVVTSSACTVAEVGFAVRSTREILTTIVTWAKEAYTTLGAIRKEKQLTLNARGLQLKAQRLQPLAPPMVSMLGSLDRLRRFGQQPRGTMFYIRLGDQGVWLRKSGASEEGGDDRRAVSDGTAEAGDTARSKLGVRQLFQIAVEAAETTNTTLMNIMITDHEAGKTRQVHSAPLGHSRVVDHGVVQTELKVLQTTLRNALTALMERLEQRTTDVCTAMTNSDPVLPGVPDTAQNAFQTVYNNIVRHILRAPKEVRAPQVWETIGKIRALVDLARSVNTVQLAGAMERVADPRMGGEQDEAERLGAKKEYLQQLEGVVRLAYEVHSGLMTSDRVLFKPMVGLTVEVWPGCDVRGKMAASSTDSSVVPYAVRKNIVSTVAAFISAMSMNPLSGRPPEGQERVRGPGGLGLWVDNNSEFISGLNSVEWIVHRVQSALRDWLDRPEQSDQSLFQRPGEEAGDVDVNSQLRARGDWEAPRLSRVSRRVLAGTVTVVRGAAGITCVVALLAGSMTLCTALSLTAAAGTMAWISLAMSSARLYLALGDTFNWLPVAGSAMSVAGALSTLGAFNTALGSLAVALPAATWFAGISAITFGLYKLLGKERFASIARPLLRVVYEGSMRSVRMASYLASYATVINPSWLLDDDKWFEKLVQLAQDGAVSAVSAADAVAGGGAWDVIVTTLRLVLRRGLDDTAATRTLAIRARAMAGDWDSVVYADEDEQGREMERFADMGMWDRGAVSTCVSTAGDVYMDRESPGIPVTWSPGRRVAQGVVLRACPTMCTTPSGDGRSGRSMGFAVTPAFALRPDGNVVGGSGVVPSPWSCVSDSEFAVLSLTRDGGVFVADECRGVGFPIWVPVRRDDVVASGGPRNQGKSKSVATNPAGLHAYVAASKARRTSGGQAYPRHTDNATVLWSERLDATFRGATVTHAPLAWVVSMDEYAKGVPTTFVSEYTTRVLTKVMGILRGDVTAATNVSEWDAVRLLINGELDDVLRAAKVLIAAPDAHVTTSAGVIIRDLESAATNALKQSNLVKSQVGTVQATIRKCVESLAGAGDRVNVLGVVRTQFTEARLGDASWEDIAKLLADLLVKEGVGRSGGFENAGELSAATVRVTTALTEELNRRHRDANLALTMIRSQQSVTQSSHPSTELDNVVNAVAKTRGQKDLGNPETRGRNVGGVGGLSLRSITLNMLGDVHLSLTSQTQAVVSTAMHTWYDAFLGGVVDQKIPPVPEVAWTCAVSAALPANTFTGQGALGFRTSAGCTMHVISCRDDESAVPYAVLTVNCVGGVFDHDGVKFVLQPFTTTTQIELTAVVAGMFDDVANRFMALRNTVIGEVGASIHVTPYGRLSLDAATGASAASADEDPVSTELSALVVDWNGKFPARVKANLSATLRQLKARRDELERLSAMVSSGLLTPFTALGVETAIPDAGTIAARIADTRHWVTQVETTLTRSTGDAVRGGIGGAGLIAVATVATATTAAVGAAQLFSGGTLLAGAGAAAVPAMVANTTVAAGTVTAGAAGVGTFLSGGSFLLIAGVGVATVLAWRGLRNIARRRAESLAAQASVGRPAASGISPRQGSDNDGDDGGDDGDGDDGGGGGGGFTITSRRAPVATSDSKSNIPQTGISAPTKRQGNARKRPAPQSPEEATSGSVARLVSTDLEDELRAARANVPGGSQLTIFNRLATDGTELTADDVHVIVERFRESIWSNGGTPCYFAGPEFHREFGPARKRLSSFDAPFSKALCGSTDGLFFIPVNGAKHWQLLVVRRKDRRVTFFCLDSRCIPIVLDETTSLWGRILSRCVCPC